MQKIIIGIDEAGRWPWAWPLVVAGVSVFDEKIFEKIPALNDSKKLSEKQRENIFQKLFEMKNSGEIDFCIMEKSAEEIDEKGIRECNRLAMQKIIQTLSQDFFKKFLVKIDGADNFSFEKIQAQYIFAKKKSRKKTQITEWENSLFECEDFVKNFSSWQNENCVQFIIWWDASERIISAASILAKVHRDTIMKQYSDDFPEYNFAKNKWYGTKQHHEAILNYGINFLHRKSYEPIKTLISSKNCL